MPLHSRSTSTLARTQTASLVIEYVAPVSVTTLLEPPVLVVHVVQVPKVEVIERTCEFPFEAQIVEPPETVGFT